MYAHSFGEGSTVQNEQGYYVGLETTPFSHNDRHNLSLNYRNDFHEYYTWNNLLVPVHKVG